MTCSSRAIGCADGGAGLLLPGTHSVRYPFVEVGWPYNFLYAREPHVLPNRISHAHESNANATLLQVPDEPQQLVACRDVYKVDRSEIQKHLLHIWRRSDGHSQPRPDVAGAREGKVAADSPNQQSWKCDRLGVQLDVTISLGAWKLPEDCSLGTA